MQKPFNSRHFFSTAVIRYRNGLDDVQICMTAKQEYEELMYRLSLDSSRHLTNVSHFCAMQQLTCHNNKPALP
jgi:hypothetical protein